MSGKGKMRCARCHKTFKAANARQNLCAECDAKERRARATAKTTPAASAATQPVTAPKIVGPGAGILVPELAQTPTQPAPDPPAATASPSRHVSGAPEPGANRPEHATDPRRASGEPANATHPQSHAQPKHGGHERTTAGRGTPGGKQSQAMSPRPRKQTTPAITLVPELRARIEARYRELADPVEFDGIRTRIAEEMSIPKALVKRVVLELRQREQMPSWWELQSYRGSEEELQRIRVAYTPYLPIPPVGIHKQIAAELRVDPGVVYQGIRRIRAEMRLPQFNPPEAHGQEAADTTDSGAETAHSVPAPAHATAQVASAPDGAQAPDTAAR
jgi:hypothetical protein